MNDLMIGEGRGELPYDGSRTLLPAAPDVPQPDLEGAGDATILIVDDEIRNCQLLEALLRRKGYFTVSAAGGKEALAMIVQHAPDLILLDVVMPGMDGYEVARILKANPLTANIPIIMVTAHTDRRTRLDGLNAGAEEFLTTPVDQSELWLRVRNLLRLKAYGDLLQDHNQVLEEKVRARAADLQRFRTAMDATADGIFLVSRTTMRFVELNATACNMLGYTREELFRMGPAQIVSTTPEQLGTEYDAIIAGDSPHKFGEILLRRKDGSCLQVEAHRQAHRAGKDWLIVAVMRDISARKETDRRIMHLNRVYAMLSGINTLIVRMRDRDELYREACRIAVEAGGFRMAMIGIVDRSAAMIVPVASAGKSEELLAAVKRLTSSRELASTTMVARAVREKQPVVSNDSQSDPQVLLGNKYADAGVRSMAILPLIVADEAVGALALYAGETEFFHAEEMMLVTELAGDIAFAIDHIDKNEKIARLSRVKAVMSGINALIVRVNDRQELFDEACRIAVENGGFGIVWIGRFDSVTQDITPTAWAGIDSNLNTTRRSARADLPEGQGLAGRAVRGKTAVFDNDIIKRPGIGGGGRKEAISRGYSSLIALPLMAEGMVLGTISLFARERDFFDAEELKLLTELADNIAFAVSNIERQEKLSKLSRIRAVSGEINAAIARIHEREALLQEVCRIAAEYGRFELVWIAAVDAEKQVIRPLAWTGLPAEVAHAVNWTNMGIGSSTLAEVLQTGRPAVRNDIQSAGAAGALRQAAVRRGCNSTICLPLLVDDMIVAVITLFAAGRNFFDANELALLNEVAADISLALQSIARREQLDYLAYYDPLTGLANRALFHERLEQGVKLAKEQGRKVALLFVDIERFKTINDTFGRHAGDALLKEVAARALAFVTDAGRLARIDADHFAVMVTDLQIEEDLVRLLEQRIGEIFVLPFRIGESELRVAAKFGIAMYPADGADADTLFRNAEAALEKAKARGERYLFYTQSMNARVAQNLSLENRLRQAIEREEFVLHYQPKVNLASGKLTSAEALIRWNDPQTGLVPPGHFIPILEETGLIYEVGRWALRQAIADYLRWRAAGLPAVRIAVNVSPLQLRHRDFVAEIGRKIGIDAHAAEGLELEITESVIMDDVRKNIDSLRAIRDTGVTIAIDDFGTGFSSLSYLARLPVDTLKIDRSFVIDMTASPEGLALVSTIINLAHALKRKVVAEGVETEEQSRLLRLLNCDEMQGYLFSKPVPGEIFETKFLAPPLAA